MPKIDGLMVLKHIRDDVALRRLPVVILTTSRFAEDRIRELLARQLGIPLIILTGAGTERLAVEALKAGMDDHLIKDAGSGYLELLPVVLPAVVQQYRDRLARQRAERERLIGELQVALAKIKTLRGLLPICAPCKKIRDDQGY